MSALALLAGSFWLPFQGLETANAAKHESDICNARFRSTEVYPVRSAYADFGPTLAAEKLRTKHGIDLAKETVRQLQIAVGLWIPRKLRRRRFINPDRPGDRVQPIESTPANISMSINFPMRRSRFGQQGSRSPTPLTISWERLIKVLSLRTSDSATPFGSLDWFKRNVTIRTDRQATQTESRCRASRANGLPGSAVG
jgi:hypothetical protein